MREVVTFLYIGALVLGCDTAGAEDAVDKGKAVAEKAVEGTKDAVDASKKAYDTSKKAYDTSKKAYETSKKAVDDVRQLWADVSTTGQLSDTANGWLDEQGGSMGEVIKTGKQVAPVAIEIGKTLDGAVENDRMIEPIFQEIEDGKTPEVDKAIAEMPRTEVIDGLTVGFKHLDEKSTARVVTERGYLVTLGVVPTHAATGYGYIKAGERLHAASPTALVELFVEKPDADTATAYLDDGGYLWNAGVFVWRTYAFRQAIERFQPDLGSALERIEALHRTPGWMSDVRAILEPVPAITIDVGIAEAAAAEGRMAVVPLDAGWSDIGSWSSLLEALTGARGKDLVASGQHLDRGSHNVLVHGGDRLVVTVGLDDVIIVDTPDALLVCHRDRAEEIKPVLDEIARTAGDRYL